MSDQPPKFDASARVPVEQAGPMTSLGKHKELLWQIRQCLDTAREIDEVMVIYLLQMALDEAALSARGARKRARPSP